MAGGEEGKVLFTFCFVVHVVESIFLEIFFPMFVKRTRKSRFNRCERACKASSMGNRETSLEHGNYGTFFKAWLERHPATTHSLH